MTADLQPSKDAIIQTMITAVDGLPDVVDPDARFDDLDIDSLVLVEMAVMVSSRFGISMEDWELQEAGTLGSGADIVLARTAERRQLRQGSC